MRLNLWTESRLKFGNFLFILWVVFSLKKIIEKYSSSLNGGR